MNDLLFKSFSHFIYFLIHDCLINHNKYSINSKEEKESKNKQSIILIYKI